MLKFHCDKCRRPVAREDAVQVRIVYSAYAPELDRVPTYRELCPGCAFELDGILFPGMEDEEREALKASWGWRDLEPTEIDRKEPGTESGTVHGPGAPIPQALRASSLYTREPLTGADQELGVRQGENVREAPKNPCGEGRCITIARIRAGMSQAELAERCYIGQGTISNWERGLGGADWESLEKALPELAEIHRIGCAGVCEYGPVCSQEEGCRYKGFRMGYGG